MEHGPQLYDQTAICTDCTPVRTEACREPTIAVTSGKYYWDITRLIQAAQIPLHGIALDAFN